MLIHTPMSMLECMPNMSKTLGSIFSTAK
jgi:hypothetical protein